MHLKKGTTHECSSDRSQEENAKNADSKSESTDEYAVVLQHMVLYETGDFVRKRDDLLMATPALFFPGLVVPPHIPL